MVPAPVISTPPIARWRRRRSAAGPHHRRERGPAPKLPPSFEERAAARAPRKTPKKDDGPGFIRLSDGDFKLPSEDLLEYVPPPAQEIDKQGLYDMAARLEQAMTNYGVQGQGQRDPHGPGGHHVRVRARARHPHRQDRPARERPGHGAGGPGGPHRRADPRQGGGRHRGAQQDPRDGLPEGDPRRRRLPRRRLASCRSASARTSRAPRSAWTWPRCRTCWSPAPPAPASRWPSTP